MMLEFELAVRFLMRRTARLLRGTALAALIGVVISVAALVITVALMTGYQGAIADALQRGNAHMVGFAIRPMEQERAGELAARIVSIDGVESAVPVLYLTALLDDPSEPSRPLPVIIKAVEKPPDFTGLEEWPSDSSLAAVIGSRLSRKADLEVGDVAHLRIPPRAGGWVIPTLAISIVGQFDLGFAEFDERWIVMPLDSVLAALPEEGVAGIELTVADPLAVDLYRERVEAEVDELLFSDWHEMNRVMFTALRWQTTSLFVVLTLVVAVASFQVSSAMVVLAIDKRPTAGILQAMGATPGKVGRALTLAGTLVGGSGVVIGVLLGVVGGMIATKVRLIRFPEDLARVYMVDHIPLVVTPGHVLLIGGICLALVFIASLWPARRIARENPVASIRSA
ncbi:MAG: ABC transporter permease [bacterium]|nr:ABC transporter permease [bacterium]